MNKNEMLKLLEALAGGVMPSGFESPQAALITDFAKSAGYAVQRDVLGNLFCRKESASVSDTDCSRKLIITAAMDAKGFLATHVSGDTVRFQAIGPFEKPEKLEGMPVRFENGIRGVIRILSSSDNDDTGKARKDVKMEDLYICLAASGEQPAQNLSVRTGDAAVLDAEVRETENGLIRTPHGDHLAGCLAVMDAMEQLKDDASAEDVIFVFLARHWPGRMGMRAAVKRAAPETCILCGGTEAAGTPEEMKAAETEETVKEKHPVDVELGAGPVIRFREKLQANDAETCRLLIRAAEQAGTAWQGEARNRDMSGAIEAMAAGSRPGTGWLGVPVRNIDTAESVFSAEEVNRCGQVLAAFCRTDRQEER